MKELLICALKRHGKPATAGDLTDAAIALAMAAGWPRRAWATLTVQTSAALLRGMEKRREIDRCGNRMENGRETPLWVPPRCDAAHSQLQERSYDLNAPLPAAPDAAGEDHPLHGTTNRQKFVLFDVMDALLHAGARQRNELLDLVQRHSRELAELAATTKRELLAAGFEDAR